MIEVNNLSKEFKINKKYEGLTGAFKSFFSNDYTIKKAVDEISFNIDKGDMVGYIGLNGAGKSTTIKILTGLMVPTSGKCVVNGMVPYESRQKYTQNIGVVFGNRTQLWWDLPISESFTVLKKIYKIPDEKYKKNLDFFREVLDINDFYLTPVRNLSLGQKMRADLMASLLHSPQVLFLDEPTIGLDILVKDKIRKALKYINKQTDTTVLLTTHDLDDIEEICNKIIVIDKGKKIFDGELTKLRKNYGKERNIIIDVKDDVKIDLSKVENINKDFISQNRDEEGRLIISINKDYVSLPTLMNHIFNSCEIRDFTVLEPQLEDIVKEIYQG